MKHPTALVEVKHLHKYFGKKHAVDDITLTIKPGETYALIGPNGAGKTTSLKMLTGLITPDSGEVWLENHNLETDPIAAKRTFGYIPDEPYTYPYLSGQAFLELTGDLLGMERDKTLKRIKELDSLYVLDQTLAEPFSEYSRGNKQKVAIMAALLHSPKILFVDEPIVGLDMQAQHTTQTLFTRFAQEGGAILVSTHSLGVAEHVSHRVGILIEGKMVLEGNVKDLLANNTSLEDLYLTLT